MKKLKNLAKSAIGNGLVTLCRTRVGRASVAHVGYGCTPDYYIKSGSKALDIRTLPVFGELAKKTIETNRSCLYYDRLYSIYQAIRDRAGGQGGITCAEVGVYKGGTSHFICELLSALKIKDWELHSFDTFEGHHSLDVGARDKQHAAANFNDTSYEEVKKFLAAHKSNFVYKGRFQDRCGEISNREFDFVHLDVDLYEPTVFGLDFFEKRMKKNAAIIVDDYGFETCPGVKNAVDEFAQNTDSFLVFHLLTGQALLIKK